MNKEVEQLLNKLYGEVEKVKKDFDIDIGEDEIAVEFVADTEEKNKIFAVLRELEKCDVSWMSEEDFKNKDNISVKVRILTL